MKSTRDQPYRTLTVSLIVCVAVSVIGYLIALHFQPQWMRDFFQWLSPTIPGLTSAEQVAKHFGYSPLAAQVNIFYLVFGSVPWTAWFCYLFWRDREYWVEKTFQSYRKLPSSKKNGTLRTLFANMTFFGISLGIYLIAFFRTNITDNISWSTALFYSGSFGSFIFLIGMTVLISITIPTIYLNIRLFFKLKEVKNG